MKPTITRNVSAVYCFFMKEGGTFQIGEWEAVALGHELTGPVVSHPFFGDRQRVAQALDALPSSMGRVILRAGNCLERDQDGLVCGFRVAEHTADFVEATKTLAPAAAL